MYKNIFNLDNKVAVITGGGGGLGREAAKGLAEFGARVVIADINLPVLYEVADAIEAQGGEVLAVETDITQFKSVQKLVALTLEKFNTIDILVNAAGINIRKPIRELAEEEWDRVIDINLKGTYICCKLVGEVFLQQKSGKVVNFGSVSSVRGHPGHPAYASSKGGVLQLTKVLAMEWAKENINVNAIGPAYIETALTAEYLKKGDNYNRIVKTIPMGRLGAPKDVVGAVIYLASRASDFVTGTLLLVDGGRTAD